MSKRAIGGAVLAVAVCGGCSATEPKPSAIVSEGDPSGANGEVDSGAVGGGTTNTGAPDPDGDGVCQEYFVRSEPTTPDILIVLDKSASMSPNTNDDMVDRWGGSVRGLQAITTALDDTIRFGLMTFPSDSDCGAGTVNVPIELENGAPISSALAGMGPQGNTPTTESLKAAKQVLLDLPVNPDALSGPKYVMLVTDGEPNCRPGELAAVTACGFNLGCIMMEAGKTQAEAVAAVQDLAGAGIKTYVIGYQTQGSAALDEMAVAGATGDTQHRAVENETALLAELERITKSAVSCEYVLEEAVPDPSYVLVKVDGKQVNLDKPNGWTISADNTRITVQGAPCQALQSAGTHNLSVDVLCQVVEVI